MEFQVGKWNELPIRRRSEPGLYLGVGEREVLLPNRYIPEEYEIGQSMRVFLYPDSEDRLTAITDVPLAEADEIVALEVVDVNQVGTFLNWGIPKDILLPFKEAKHEYKVGQTAVVRVIADTVSGRIYATESIKPFLNQDTTSIQVGQQFDALVWRFEEYGVRCIINQEFEGLIHNEDLLKEAKIGQFVKVWVKSKLDNGKLNLQMRAIGLGGVHDAKSKILGLLELRGGELPYGDKSDPNELREIFGMSKKTFKQAIGMLYKEGLIDPGPFEIKLKN